MSMSVGASSNALAYLQQLLQQGTAGASSSTGAADPLSELMQTLSGSGSDTDPLTAPPSTAAGSGASGVPPFGSGTMAQLLSVQNQSGNGPEQAFFSKLDTDGDGKISKTEFESAASKAGVDNSTADAVFDKIDGNTDGSVSQGELAKADHGGHHHVHGGGGGGGGDGGLDALMSGAGANGATTKTTTNADGSSTTTISYADGSSIDMNTPAAPTPTTASTSGDGSSSNSSDSGSGSSTSSQATSNLLEQLIKMQSQMLSAMQASASTMSIAA
jgi:hypothetical protein